MSEVTSALAKMPAFEEMIQAQKQLAEEVQAAADEAAAEAARAREQESALAACVDAAYLIAAADGVTTVDEVSHIVERMQALTDEIAAEQVGEMIAQAQVKVAAQGDDAVVGSLADRLPAPEQREAAFKVAANLSWTGGGISAKEGLMLQAIAAAFGWDQPRMHQLLAEARG